MYINSELLTLVTYGHSQINDVISYIQNQEEHHRKKSFREEYLTFLKRFEVPHDPKYLFEFFDFIPSNK
ncbi:MAG: hypothetical protein ABIQ74_11725 [Chitinophagales bacterium]